MSAPAKGQYRQNSTRMCDLSCHIHNYILAHLSRDTLNKFHKLKKNVCRTFYNFGTYFTSTLDFILPNFVIRYH